MEYKAEIFDLMQLLFDETGFNDHQLHCEMGLRSPLDEEVLARAVELSLKAFPILATRFSPRPEGGAWESLPVEELGRAFIATREAGAFEEARIYRIREELGPQVRFCLLCGDRNALAVTMNHMVSDAAGFKDYLYFVCETYSRLSDDPLWVPAKTPSAGRGLDEVLGGASLPARVAGFFGKGGGSNHAGRFIFPLEEGGEAKPIIATRTMDREEVSRLQSYCRARGATINDAALAAFCRVLARRLGPKAYGRLEVPLMVDMRRCLPAGEPRPLCNLTSTVALRVGESEGESFERTLIKAKSEMDGLKRNRIGLGGFVKMSLLFSVLGGRRALPLLKRGFRNPLICMTNIGEIDSKRLVFKGSVVESAYVCGSIKYKPHFQLALSGFGGTITLSSNLYGTAQDRKTVDGFLAEVEEELRVPQA
jgi:NRPS condensation-like uncharacterized protein